MEELSQWISDFYQHGYSYFDRASFTLFCLQEDKQIATVFYCGQEFHLASSNMSEIPKV